MKLVMKTLAVAALACLSLSSCTKQPDEKDVARRYAVWFADSEMARFPEAWMLDHGTAPYFGYSQGVGCCAMLAVWRATGDEKYFDYVEKWADTLVNDNGEIHRYNRAAYNLDFINSGKVLLSLYAENGKEKYRRALDMLVDQLREQPRTSDGGFWHKKIYPWQMWLDGL